MFETPESAAAAASPGETLRVDASADGRWAVVLRRHRQTLGFALCRCADGGWVVEDDGEMAPPWGSLRSTWISLVDFEVEDGPNVGVEISWGVAPVGAVRALLRSGNEEFVAPVHDGRYSLVRWQVPDPGENDNEDLTVSTLASD
jgi:hypothetical protein